MKEIKKVSSLVAGLLLFFLIGFTLVSDPSALPRILDLNEGEVLSETISILENEPSASPDPSGKETVLVTRVIDGDTIEIEGGQKIRYIGIDTPESKHPNKPVQCFAKEATKRNQKLVLNKRIQLEKDVNETDRYGRLLRYIYVDGEMVNKKLVEEGFAQSSAFPPDIKYQHIFDEAQQIAQDQSRGLWGNVCLVE